MSDLKLKYQIQPSAHTTRLHPATDRRIDDTNSQFSRYFQMESTWSGAKTANNFTYNQNHFSSTSIYQSMMRVEWSKTNACLHGTQLCVISPLMVINHTAHVWYWHQSQSNPCWISGQTQVNKRRTQKHVHTHHAAQQMTTDAPQCLLQTLLASNGQRLPCPSALSRR